MNIENILKLADHLENNIADDKFEMETYLRRGLCGSVGCIAGHAYLLNEGTTVHSPVRLHPGEVSRAAAGFLGLDSPQSRYLFCGYWTCKPLEDILRLDAVRFLRHIASKNWTWPRNLPDWDEPTHRIEGSNT